MVGLFERVVENGEATLAPATYKDYRGSIENYLVPFFEKEPMQLHDVRYDTLMRILNSINREGKGKLNVMYLSSCLPRLRVEIGANSRGPAVP